MRFECTDQSRLRLATLLVALAACLGPAPHAAASAVNVGDVGRFETVLQVPAQEGIDLHLNEGQVVELSAAILAPSELPDNARLRITLDLAEPPSPEAPVQRENADELAIYTAPTHRVSKVLHALDADVYFVYQAKAGGLYRLKVAPEQGPVDLFAAEGRWREKGAAPQAFEVDRQVPWPPQARSRVAITIHALDLSDQDRLGLVVEAEPNDTPEQAQVIAMPPVVEAPGEDATEAPADDFSIQVMAGSDDIEYFDNGHVGRSGDDWYRIDYRGRKRQRLMTACLQIPDQQVAARIRFYVIENPDACHLQIKAYKEGQNSNERTHQQEEEHRLAINRLLEPGSVYLMRVEANAPGYELDLRFVTPAPYDDPRQAIRRGLYDHIAQVNAWLNNRPRGASVERRIRAVGSLLGTHCMSCHTQSGVWGPAVPLQMGYRPQNMQPFRNLVNICYQSMRPTNELKDAANNTSAPSLDIGDGPAGTRVAGHAAVSIERARPARKLQSMQSTRAANYVLLTGDPGGINAAGPGANVGAAVVFNYAGEVLYEAWKRTGRADYFHKLEEKARKVLDVEPKYTDDLCHRVELLSRYFPKDYVHVALRVADNEGIDQAKRGEIRKHAQDLQQQIHQQVQADLARLRDIQKEDGGWGFAPGTKSEDGEGWHLEKQDTAEPSPTALALIALQVAGFDRHDPAVQRGVEALLRLQKPSGYWRGSSATGFVATSYVLHALSRLYPTEAVRFAADAFKPAADETLVQTLRRVRDLSDTEDPRFVARMVAATSHHSPLVRYWAVVGVGGVADGSGLEALVQGLGDRVKMVREAAHWSLRQALINDRGWEAVFAAASGGDDRTRAAAMRALLMRVDTVLTDSSVNRDRLAATLAAAMNDDPHPAVRAWAMRAAWNWWVWNPPLRSAVNDAWLRRLTGPEPNRLVENCLRYQSHALFVVNGNKARGSKDHQYLELKDLIEKTHAALAEQIELVSEGDLPDPGPLPGRLVAMASTFYQKAGGDGGPGQMGYHTEGASSLFAEAVRFYLRDYDPMAPIEGDLTPLRLGLEGAANIDDKPLQRTLIQFSLTGPQELRVVASSSVSDPKSVTLTAVPEQVEPIVRQIRRGSIDPARRPVLSDPLFDLFARVRWNVPQRRDQRDQIMTYLIPDPGPFLHQTCVEQIADVGQREQTAKRIEHDWYLAQGFGRVMAENPDLQIDAAVDRFPESFDNPIVARFWLPSAAWVLKFKQPLPEVQVDESQLPPIDPLEELRSRVLRLYLDELTADADPRNRELAVSLANSTALRQNPELMLALEQMLDYEEREEVVKTAKLVLSTGKEKYLEELKAAASAEEPRVVQLDEGGALPEAFVVDFTYFRDHMIPEMNRVLRKDQRACMSCHGEPGRVPSMQLNRPDEIGHLPVDKLLENYRILQQRVDVDDLDNSLLLRKPLNLQTAEEEGHQDGRRYKPDDPGYLILRKWAENQKAIRRAG